MRFGRIAPTLLMTAASALAQQSKSELPRITAVSPLQLIVGETQTVRLRGSKLKEVTEVRSTPALNVTVKEKKDAAVPTGLEAKDVGDQEIVLEVSVPTVWSAKDVSLEAVAPNGTSAPRVLLFGSKDDCLKEKEPNNGFREAQPVDQSKPIVGRIEADKDVDVFRVDGHSGTALNVRITASLAGSLLDPILSIFDGGGSLLGSVDDADGNLDARLSVTPTADGPLCVVVSDAHDRGGPWHEYRLRFEPLP